VIFVHSIDQFGLDAVASSPTVHPVWATAFDTHERGAFPQQGPSTQRRLLARAFFILKKPRPGLGAMAGACEPTYPHAALFVGRE
jgi:hypothetical protein